MESFSFSAQPDSRREPLVSPGERATAPDDHAARLIEELQVHRVELEMQNRALREAQADLEASVRMFSDLYDHVPSGYLTLSTSGQILQANLTASEWLRCDRRNLVGAFFRTFLAPFDAGRFAAHLEQCEHSDRICQFEAILQLDQATTLPVQLASRLVRSDKDESRKLHCALTRTSKLTEVQRELEESRSELEAYSHAAAETVRGGDATRIFSRLLEYSRLRRAPMDLAVVPLRALVDAVVRQFQPDIDARRAEVVVAPELPAVRASPAALENALAALFNHGLRNANPGEPSRVRISAAARGPFVVLTLTHDGVAVASEHQQSIFDIAPRPGAFGSLIVDQTGLAMARRAVLRMGGRIWVHSMPGDGSCFSVELPAG